MLDDDNQPIDPANIGAIGRLARSGSVPIGYYRDPEKSARTFLEVDGKRYSVPGDFARIEADTKVTLLGRGSNCINTGGEKVYPEEVEMALKSHPDVYDALVVGLPDEKWGHHVSAVIQSRSAEPPSLEELHDPPPPAAVRLQAAALRRVRRRDPAHRHRQGELPRSQGHRRSRSPQRRRGGSRLMRTELCERFGIEYPIFAFTPSEHVAAAVSTGRRPGRAGLLSGSTTPTSWTARSTGSTTTRTASRTASTS